MSHNTLLHRLIRPAISRLADTAVTPNHVTTLRLATGLAAAAAFAAGGTFWPDLGAGAMLLSLLLDRADGELARASGKMSLGGYRYDLFADGLSTVAAFVGMGFGARSMWGPASILLGLLAAVGVLWLFLVMPKIDARPHGSSERPLDPDDALLGAPLLVWAGLMSWTVLITAVISLSLAVVLTALALIHRRRVYPTRSRAC
jgi:phosphatidylglycerophosphate synthase